LFLAALCGGTAAIAAVLVRIRGVLSRRDLALAAALVVAAAATTLPFARELAHGLLRGVGYVAGTTHAAVGGTGYVPYPAGWLNGIFEARPLLADGPALAAKQLSLAFFLAPVSVVVWALRRERRGVHLTLAVWGAVTLFLALSQRLNVYYAAPLAALTLIETLRWIGRRAGFAAAAVAGGVLLLPTAWCL